MTAPLLYVGTPLRGGDGYHPIYCQSLDALRDSGIPVIVPRNVYFEDVVRVRARIVQDFLESQATHLLFVDSDIGFAPTTVQGMLDVDEGYVCAPYPKKRIHWDRLTDATPIREAEAILYDYSVGFAGVPHVDTTKGTVTGVLYCGLGMTLLTRDCLREMVAHYGEDPELVFQDVPGAGTKRRTVSLFHLKTVDGHLLSEDYSFGHRWRDMGGEIHLYLGDGSPVAHAGEHIYRGQLAAFGLRRRPLDGPG